MDKNEHDQKLDRAKKRRKNIDPKKWASKYLKDTDINFIKASGGLTTEEFLKEYPNNTCCECGRFCTSWVKRIGNKSYCIRCCPEEIE